MTLGEVLELVPDGASIAYVTEPVVDPYDRAGFGARLMVVDVATRTRRALLPDVDATMPTWSPDGRWIAYAYATAGGVGAVGFYSVQANGTPKILPPGRSGPRFLGNDLVWYIGERACATCFGGQPQATGVTYIYSIAGASEVTSRLASVSDVWHLRCSTRSESRAPAFPAYVR